MPSLNPRRDDRTRQKVAENFLELHEGGLRRREKHAHENIEAEIAGVRVARQFVRIDTPSHTPGTSKGEEWSLKTQEKGRVGKTRHARSATSINPLLHDAVDHRMPHLPPA